ncbi:hypothetical protein ACFU6S_21545 [Streptomyces sp. NPDC057456]|uniref:hypothetical protein n=1 Tax=Streptomyces sp. NPDC057456 TaxID=3346139 RepID=UPI003692EB5E
MGYDKLAPTGRGDHMAAGLIKDLAERLPATSVYAGIDVTGAPHTPSSAGHGRPARRTRHPWLMMRRR